MKITDSWKSLVRQANRLLGDKTFRLGRDDLLYMVNGDVWKCIAETYCDNHKLYFIDYVRREHAFRNYFKTKSD